MATVTLKGNPVTVGGNLPKAGDTAPDFLLTGKDLADVALTSWNGKRKVLNIVPSLDTPTCQKSTRVFNEKASAMDNAVVLVIAADLPFVSADQVGELAARRRAVDAPVALAVDEAGHTQYLLGVWRADALRTALSTADASMRSLVPGGVLAVPLADTDDIDTLEDLAQARLRITPLQRVADALAPLH